MSKSKISLKNSLLKIAGVFLIVIMVATIGSPKLITAEQTVPINQYFVVRKEWENDLATGRPDSVTIKVIDSADTTKQVLATGTMTATSDWKCEFTLPAYYTGTTNKIQYAVYEEPTNPKELDKYELSNPIDNPLIIEKSLLVEDNSERKVVTTYTVNHLGFDAVPTGSIFIDSKLDLATAEIIMDSNIFTYYPEFTIYGDHSGYSNTQKRIVYTGDLGIGDNPLTNKTIVLKWSSKARDYFTGQRYKVRITISDIVIHSEAEITNSAEGSDPKYVALVAYADDLHMDAYLGPTFDPWKENIVGVKANIKIEVLDGSDKPVKGFTNIYVSDLDQPDYFDMYNTDGDNRNWGDYFGVERNWTESVKLKGGVASEIYLNTESVIENALDAEGNIKFSSSEYDSRGIYTSLKFLAATDGSFEYEWAGSNCGTVIVSSGTVPPINTFTNFVENTSSFYQARYFFQNDNGTYNETPDARDPVTMIKPESKVSVNANAKTEATLVDETKTNYVIDESKTNRTEQKTVTTSHTAEEPQILDVYFKQSCMVVYHDNFGDELWKPDDQTTTELSPGVKLSLNDPTPKFDDGDGGITPVNPGYKFLGWSEIDIDEWTAHGTDEGPIFTPPTVQPDKVSKKRTDYLAHWEALPNLYEVQYFYEVDGVYPIKPDFTSEPRRDKKTGELATIIEEDKIPDSSKPNYYLNSGMTSEWSKIVKGDGETVVTILKVYFKRRSEPIKIPVTGIE